MLTAYRRHGRGCSLASMGQRKCKCPIWVNGRVQGKVLRKALKTRNWEAAQRLVRELEVGKMPAVLVKEACEAFTRDSEARNLSYASIGKYKLLVKELKQQFADREIDGISVQDLHLREYRESRKLSPISARKKLERLRTFFRFC